GRRVGAVAVRTARQSAGEVVPIEQVEVALLAPQGNQMRRAGLTGVEVRQENRRAARQIDVVLVELAVVPRRIRGLQPERQRGRERQQRLAPVVVERTGR